MTEQKTVLLVEDDPDQILMYDTEFTAHGLNVITAKNGEEGIETAKAKHPDIILVDELMEGMNGTEALKVLKQEPETKDIPVIIFSNLEKSEMAVKAKEMGAADYVIKSKVVPREMVDKIKAILGN